MMNLHQSSALQVLGLPDRQLRLDGVLALQVRRTGWLSVCAGQVWITRSGDSADHVLGDGQAMQLCAGQRVLAEPWRAGQVCRLRWAVSAPQPVQTPRAPLGLVIG